MKPEQQRIAIAEACGWKQTHIMQMGSKGKYVRTYQKGRGKLYQCLPDYLNDLNAMHEAEKSCIIRDEPLETKYWMKLYDIAQSTRWPFDATAAQRAEAFLRTIGKWEDAQ